MGREVKRVALDFKWPRNVTWEGFLNPHNENRESCEMCEGTGLNAATKRMRDQWYGEVPFDPVLYGAKPLTVGNPGVQAFALRNVKNAPYFYGSGASDVQREARRLFQIFAGCWCNHLIQADVDALVAADRLWEFTRVPRNEEQKKACPNGWTEQNGYRPTADEVNEWSIRGFGHDSINCSVCVKARAEREGVYGECLRCKGAGEVWRSPEDKERYDAWTETEPPAGDGWQMWETVSEGSPISPVFSTPEELARWLFENGEDAGGVQATYKQWLGMIKAGWAPSAVKDAKGFRSGVEAIGDAENEKE